MKIALKMTGGLLDKVHADLDRNHPFAAERVGFLTCGIGAYGSDGILLLTADYMPLRNDEYEQDMTVGASITGAAFRSIMQRVYSKPACVVHVHRHDHRGVPSPSRTDAREMTKFMPDFFNVRPEMPHAALILSLDHMWGACWLPHSKEPVAITDFKVAGAKVKTWRKL